MPESAGRSASSSGSPSPSITIKRRFSGTPMSSTRTLRGWTSRSAFTGEIEIRDTLGTGTRYRMEGLPDAAAWDTITVASPGRVGMTEQRHQEVVTGLLDLQ